MTKQSPIFQRKSKCPGCGSTNAKLFYQLPTGVYVRCQNCSLVSTDPLLDPVQLQQRAEHWAVEHHKSQTKIAQHYSPTFQQIAFAPHLSRLNRYYQTGRTIDIGCGIGGFVHAAQSAGWDSYGVDVSSSIEIAEQHGLKVFRVAIEESEFPEDYFDAVTLFDVIEHIPDPDSLFKHLKKVIRTDGCVYLQTPNLAGINARLLGSYWESLEPEDHVCLYTPTSLAYILKRHGFSVVNVQTVDLNLVELRHAFQKNRGDTWRKQRQQERRQLINQVMKSSVLQIGRKIANRLLTRVVWGDKLIIEARKIA